MDRKRKQQLLTAIALLLLVVLNYPVVNKFVGEGSWLEIDRLYIYVVGVWLLAIVVLAVVQYVYFSSPKSRLNKDE
ncbi:MAG: hypothetical protein CL843_13950 [Crocinitomicaceae bacterium]|nr:hypothetical protein [Crocinitomicaceae bacterium]|tara:strand:+ start:317 stop:544 length:228 start_codon:yes stop_codon:yes gene_type:complete